MAAAASEAPGAETRAGAGQSFPPGADSRDCILEPLSLPESPGGPTALEVSTSVPCIFCEEHYPGAEKDKLLKHMILEHKVVIADIKLIADFRKYILYWKRRFAEQPIIDFCSVIRTNSQAPPEEQEHYFLLCDVLPEDRILREKLQQKRLEEVLEQQQHERDDTSFQGMCMFCTEEFSGNRSVLLNHMAREHDFNMGLPDNIVHCREFLATLQEKLDRNWGNPGKKFSQKMIGSCWTCRKRTGLTGRSILFVLFVCSVRSKPTPPTSYTATCRMSMHLISTKSSLSSVSSSSGTLLMYGLLASETARRSKLLPTSEAGQLYPAGSTPGAMLRLPGELQLQGRPEGPHGGGRTSAVATRPAHLGPASVLLPNL
ncbi:zinc finger protein 277 isoform X2 [Ornithorhynchus anatinus]|uniref:zinc finger protein 277 isoform X2 n=1 Tax=Ornithorhynchus anatinus TaxID=9258 RepID=UPI0019D4B915|nr:zinc finger protein 277 isoform X2 [Ornithorhynchus anatinus]